MFSSYLLLLLGCLQSMDLVKMIPIFHSGQVYISGPDNIAFYFSQCVQLNHNSFAV